MFSFIRSSGQDGVLIDALFGSSDARVKIPFRDAAAAARTPRARTRRPVEEAWVESGRGRRVAGGHPGAGVGGVGGGGSGVIVNSMINALILERVDRDLGLAWRKRSRTRCRRDDLLLMLLLGCKSVVVWGLGSPQSSTWESGEICMLVVVAVRVDEEHLAVCWRGGPRLGHIEVVAAAVVVVGGVVDRARIQ